MTSHTMPSSRAMTRPATADTLQTRYALRIATRLSERTNDLHPEIGERLRVAREQALERARAVRVAEAAPARAGVSGGALVLGGGSRWWLKVAAVLPAVALIAGLIAIQQLDAEAQISTAAEIDAALLTDDLPPNAYSDAGFAEFLKTPRE